MALDDTEDDASVLLQTYAALDAFLHEMNALDAPPVTSLQIVQQVEQHQQDDKKHASLVFRNGVNMESVRCTQPARATAITTQLNASSAVAGATSASRKRKHESRTSVVVSIQSNQPNSSTNSESIDTQLSSRPVRRRRQKDELIVLRQQALDLETQLQSIKAAMEPSVADSKTALVKQKRMQALAWEAHALQEKRMKQSTECENARLKELASKELKASFEIDKMLIKCYTSALSFLPYGRNAGLALEAHDTFLYEMLEQNADVRLRDLEVRGFELSPSSLQPQSSESRIVLMGNHETGVEFKRSHVVPFDSASVNKVSWKAILSNNDNFFTLKDVRVKENMVAIHARVRIHREGEEDVLLEGHHVCKRVCGKQRTFMAWEGLTQWKVANADRDASDSLCLPTRESGWGVMQPLLLPGAVPVTQVQICTSALPTRVKRDHNGAQTEETGREDSVREANLLRDLIIPSMEQMFVTQQQLVENALLDDSLRRT